MISLKNDRFYLAADCVVFTILHKELKILLIRRKNEPFRGRYALPGGFVELHENLKEAALRELAEETGVKNIFLEQLHTYSDVKRDPRARIISVAYLALISADDLKLHATTDAELAQWFSVYHLPELGFDHHTIVEDALQRLRVKLETTNIAFQLMPDKFTLSELQNAYEIILDRKLDKRNFRKKQKELNLLKELQESKMEGAHRPAKLFYFKGN